jgi:hypothetical protein
MAARASRIAQVACSLVLVAVGFLCLNYTKGFDMDHHVEWARQHDMPAPSYAIFLAGALLGALGAGGVGHAIGGRACPATKGPT